MLCIQYFFLTLQSLRYYISDGRSGIKNLKHMTNNHFFLKCSGGAIKNFIESYPTPHNKKTFLFMLASYFWLAQRVQFKIVLYAHALISTASKKKVTTANVQNFKFLFLGNLKSYWKHAEIKEGQHHAVERHKVFHLIKPSHVFCLWSYTVFL